MAAKVWGFRAQGLGFNLNPQHPKPYTLIPGLGLGFSVLAFRVQGFGIRFSIVA